MGFAKGDVFVFSKGYTSNMTQVILYQLPLRL